MHGLGTLINIVAVLAGTAAGALLGDRLTAALRESMVAGLGLFTLALGIANAQEAFGGTLAAAAGRSGPLLVLGSLLVGGLLGEAARLDQRLEALGERLRRRLTRGGGHARFVEGFVLASLVFCVGPLTVLGSIADGLRGDYNLLAIKSLLDGFASLAFASYLGWGVGASVLVILGYQGGLTVLASSLAGALSAPIVASMTATGGLLIIAIGLRLLELRQLRVANLLPAIVLAPLATAAVHAVR